MTREPLLNVKGYEFRERVSAGGSGVVYRAYQPSVQREVAVKVIQPRYANQPDFIRRFEVEAQIIARLEHPHIVPLYDYWRDPQGAYLVLRWLPENLRSSIRRSAWTLEKAARLLDQLAQALTVAHREGIIHRDIKPENILLDEDENAYLADFGIAKNTQLRELHLPDDEFVDSPAYSSPEQIRSEELNGRSDIYSLGYVLYEVLAGHSPFPDAKTPSEQIQKHLTEPLPMISLSDSGIPAALDEVLQTATAKNPSHRYPSALRFATAFRAAVPNVLPRIPFQPLAQALTERELVVLRLMVEGSTNSEISERLVLSPTTVKWYVRQLYKKLDVHSRQQAVERAITLRLTERDSVKALQPIADNTPTLQVQEPSVGVLEPENPYKGLRAFQEADSPDFFGRAALTEGLLSRLSDEGDGGRFVVIVGPSGSGKSSFVRAGLIPALRAGALKSSPCPFIADFLPGSHPLEELEAALLRVAVNPVPGLSDLLREDRRGLVRAVKRVLPNDLQTELILVIDQFEELFTLVADEKVRVHFIDNVLAAVADPRGRVRVILTLRADFYDRPLLYPRLAELVRANTEVVVPLTAREMEQAISAPADRVGVRLESGLVATILKDVGEQPGTLPLLQYALTELFDQREGLVLTLRGYHQTGGVLGALARRAQSVYNQLDAAGQQLAKQLFLRLITLGEGAEDTRRRTLFSELTAIGDKGAIEDVIDVFAQYRLLTFDHDLLTRSPTVEIAHEALIREWEQLREWLRISREDVRQQRRLALAAAEWNAGGDTSFLASGSKLQQFESWIAESTLLLTAEEQAYLDSSIAERQRAVERETIRRFREQRLERRSQTFLRSLVAILLIATLGAFGLMSYAVGQENLARTERDNARASFQRAEALRLAAEARGQILSSGSAEAAALLAIQSLNIQYTPQGDEALVAASLLDYPIQRFVGHTDRVKAVDYSQDGRLVLTGSGDSTVRVWDVTTGQEIRRFEGDMQDINSAVFSPDSGFVLTGSRNDHTVRLWDLASGEEVRRWGNGNAGSFSLDGGRIFVFSEDNAQSTMIDIETSEILHTILAPQLWRRPESTGYSPDGTLYLDIPIDSDRMFIRRVADDAEILSLPISRLFQNFAFSPDNRYFVVNGDDNSVEVWDITTRERLHVLAGTLEVITLAFSPDSRLLAAGTGERAVRVWDVASGHEVRQFNGHTQSVRNVKFSGDSRYLLSGGFDKVALLWDLRSTTPLEAFDTENFGFWYTHVSPDGQLLSAGREDGTVLVWNLHSNALLYQIQAGSESIWFADFTPDNRLLVTASGNTVQVWDTTSSDMIGEIPVFESVGNINDFALTSNHLITSHSESGDWAGGMILWDLVSLKEQKRYTTPTHVNFVDSSSDGQWMLAYESSRSQYTLFNVETGEILNAFPGFTPNLNGRRLAAFSPDNTYLVTTEDVEGALWYLTAGTLAHQFKGHRDVIFDITFSHDGQIVATLSNDGTLRLWDAARGAEVRRITTPYSPISVNFSKDDRQLIVLGSDERIHFVQVAIADSLRQLCEYLRRDFTSEERDQYQVIETAPTCSWSDPSFVE